ncbi:hypothetical protein LguiB_023912 [Lonicera macranthoides]
MWRFKSFTQKEQTGLEGRTIEVGNLKITIRNAIAEGGFSCVYLARDAVNGSKQYAVKHIICNDQESLGLVMKEISVMKSLRGHPNIVMLYAHTIFDMGRTKEALLVMEHCEKSMVKLLESRGGAGYFEEKQILAMFRDICNAVFAMHCQSPPIAHRDLKAENLLLGSDRLWKLCDFGSISTNHKRFEKAEDMGIEEDNIRKHTTPAYRAPEMWDLLRREFINEKVDIWALGCLLFRICYLKPAFDGESKLQVLNGNYCIPDLPNYNHAIKDLIKDMLHPSPNARPDITQASALLDWPFISMNLGTSRPANTATRMSRRSPSPSNTATPVPRRSPSPSNTATPVPRRSPSPSNTDPARNRPLGAFWNTQHANDSESSKRRPMPSKPEPTAAVNTNALNAFVANFSKPETTTTVNTGAFNAFVAEFGIDNKPGPGSNNSKKPLKEELLEGEVERLKEQLKQANVEKGEVNSKCEKLTAICRSQQQEIQGLKQALASRIQSPKIDASRNQTSPGVQLSTTQQKESSWIFLHGGSFNLNPDS